MKQENLNKNLNGQTNILSMRLEFGLEENIII